MDGPERIERGAAVAYRWRCCRLAFTVRLDRRNTDYRWWTPTCPTCRAVGTTIDAAITATTGRADYRPR